MKHKLYGVEDGFDSDVLESIPSSMLPIQCFKATWKRGGKAAKITQNDSLV